MSNKHTPGPWSVCAAQTYRWEVKAGKQAVARITTPTKGGSDASTANARLIAAAPELLALAESLRAWWEAHGIEGTTETDKICTEARRILHAMKVTP